MTAGGDWIAGARVEAARKLMQQRGEGGQDRVPSLGLKGTTMQR